MGGLGPWRQTSPLSKRPLAGASFRVYPGPMVLCPGALLAGCKKCPIVALCPAKSLIGDWKPEDEPKKGDPKNAG